MTQQPPSTYIDDDIDLMPYIKHVVNNWRLFIYASLIGIIIALILAFILPKKFKASTTFIMPETVASNLPGGGILASLGYSSFSGGSASGVYSGYIMPIFNSYRIKAYVAQSFIADARFTSMDGFLDLDQTQQVNTVISTLAFSKNITLEQKEGVYVISYISKEPSIILPVLNAYLNALIQLNDELNIDSDVLQIIPLDEAIEPKGAFFPNQKKFILIAVAIALFGVGGYLVVEKVVRNLFDHKKPHSLD